jgi:hypothetical protein
MVCQRIVAPIARPFSGSVRVSGKDELGEMVSQYIIIAAKLVGSS